MKTRISKVLILGQGKECPKCKRLMERRKHRENPTSKTYFYSEWDYCKPCGHVQHYEEFKNSVWQEQEQIESHMRSIV